jgi:hypothetical protein
VLQTILFAIGTLSVLTFLFVVMCGTYDSGKARLARIFGPLYAASYFRRASSWRSNTLVAKSLTVLLFLFLWLAFERGFNAALSWVPENVGYYSEDGYFNTYVSLFSFVFGGLSALFVFSLMVEQLESYIKKQREN